MFFDELQPIFSELFHQPAAFFGGFVSGILRINPNDEPLKSWLDSQGAEPGIVSSPEDFPPSSPTGGPQSIEIE